MDSNELKPRYNDYYYNNCCGAKYDRGGSIWDYFSKVADQIVARIAPFTALDAGCAKGFLVELLRRRGVEAWGFDISDFAIGETTLEIRPYCRVGSVTDPLDRDYDLIICQEVLEHVSEEEARQAIRNLCFHTSDILFSSSPLDLKEPTHVNVHPPEYWSRLFAEQGFFRDFDFDPSFITRWAVRFRKKNPGSILDLGEAYEKELWRITHDNLTKDERIAGLSHSLKERDGQAASLRQAIVQRDGQIAILSEALTERDVQLGGLKQTVLERDGRIAGLHQALTDRDGQIAILNNAVAERDRQNVSLNQAADERDGRIAGLKIALNEKDAVLSRIYDSHGWKTLSAYYKARNRMLPVGTRRRALTVSLFKSLAIAPQLTHKANFISSIYYLKNHGSRAFLQRVKERVRKDDSAVKNGRIDPEEEIKDTYLLWIEKNEPREKELEEQKNKTFHYEPKISIIVPVFNTPKQFLTDMLLSVFNQTYSNWELCIADGGSKEAHVRKILKKHAQKESRIKIKLLEENRGIAGNSNEALSLASGEFVALLDHDDMLPPFALHEVVKTVNENPNADFLYSDEDKLSEDGQKRFEPYFKPDWGPDTFLSVLYASHFGVCRKRIVDQLGGFRKGYEGSQDSDLILRISEKTEHIVHIPKILYHWRKVPGSASFGTSEKSYAYVSARKALTDYLERNSIEGVVSDGFFKGAYRVQRAIRNVPKVSIIIPFRDQAEALRKCVTSILKKTEYRNFEIDLINNQSEEKETLDYLDELKDHSFCRLWNYDKPFNFSAIINYAVSQLDAEYLILLNNDTEVISPDWIGEMLQFAQREDVGAVGALLCYPNDTVQHAGVIIRTGGGVAGHSHKNAPRKSYGYFGRIKIVQNLSAVTAACMMTKKSVFEKVNGFDETFARAYNDVDFCLRVREKGYLIVYTPYAELYHHECLSRGYDDTPQRWEVFKREEKTFRQRWEKILAKGDPCYNPNLTRDKEDFSIGI